jgi:hypothetical protein
LAENKSLTAVETFIGKKIEFISIEGVDKTAIIPEKPYSANQKKSPSKRARERKAKTANSKTEKASKKISTLQETAEQGFEEKGQKHASKTPVNPETLEADIIGMGSHVPAFMLRSCVNKDE